MSYDANDIVVVVDTNVIISAVLSAGPPRQVLDLGLRRLYQVVLSKAILHEVESVLVKKIKWKLADAQSFSQWLSDQFTIVDPPESVNLIKRKDSDNRILESVLAAKADYLVTGDKQDLLPLKTYHGTKIVKPIEFLGCLNMG